MFSFKSYYNNVVIDIYRRTHMAMSSFYCAVCVNEQRKFLLLQTYFSFFPLLLFHYLVHDGTYLFMSM